MAFLTPVFAFQMTSQTNQTLIFDSQMVPPDPSGADFRVFDSTVNIAASPGTVTEDK
ncbi:hypothetical protein QA601_13545 [Chitinispirillales bacterium ANBcel5]|uniref:hypothetical protein n=1 Tax=Cellulosispirillum alkaliphilum TaxID=3039283 RepID=UPI002A543DF3|nr:hypothetical protein [Chitinispirillales bacterium ANBcel5]